jgi:hypothetical protein
MLAPGNDISGLTSTTIAPQKLDLFQLCRGNMAGVGLIIVIITDKIAADDPVFG